MKKLANQHGDLILEAVGSIPKDAKRVKNFDGIVLKGEGVNTHTLNPADVEIFTRGETMYLRVKKNTKLDHQEHGQQTLKKGKVYKRVIEREYNYEKEEARQTRD